MGDIPTPRNGHKPFEQLQASFDLTNLQEVSRESARLRQLIYLANTLLHIDGIHIDTQKALTTKLKGYVIPVTIQVPDAQSQSGSNIQSGYIDFGISDGKVIILKGALGRIEQAHTNDPQTHLFSLTLLTDTHNNQSTVIDAQYREEVVVPMVTPDVPVAAATA